MFRSGTYLTLLNGPPFPTVANFLIFILIFHSFFLSSNFSVQLFLIQLLFTASWHRSEGLLEFTLDAFEEYHAHRR